MAHVDSAAKVVSVRRLPRRLWFPLAAILLALVAIGAIEQFLADSLDSGTRLMLFFISAVVAAIAIVVWFFTMSGLAWSTRLLGALLLIFAVVSLPLSVRRVEFSGDMVPTFDFRWSVDRAELLEAHRALREESQAAPTHEGPATEPIEITAGPWDVLEYRGPRRDGVIEGPKLARDWSARPPRLVWRQPVGGGYASFVVAGPLVITIEQRREKEAVVAYDVDTGLERWLYDYPAFFHETLGGDGPRATPTIHEGKVYSLGATGVLACLELASGHPLWSVNILVQNASVNLDWAMSGAPLIYDDLVLVNPGNQKGLASSRGITTFSATSGKPMWGGGETKAGYASPMLVMLAGASQVINFDGVGLAGYDDTDGRELWRVPWTTDFDINAAQPVLVGDDQVLISSSAGAALVKVSFSEGRWRADEVWKSRKMKCGYSCPIVYQGYVYGMDENILTCLDLATGKPMWKDRAAQYGHGQMLRRDDLLVVLAESGELALVEATPEGFHELGRIQAIEGKTWNNPTLVGGRIFVRNHLEMAAYVLPTRP
jgi:outer membrane protein assembly factor BamB